MYPVKASGSGDRDTWSRDSSISSMSHHEFAKALDDELHDFGGQLHADASRGRAAPLRPLYENRTAVSDAKKGDSDDEEEVQLVHQMPHAGAKKAEALQEVFHELEEQLEAYKGRVKDLYNKLHEANEKNAEMEEKIDMLEEEARELHDVVGNEGAGGGMTIAIGGTQNIGGGSRKQKDTKSGEALRGALDDQLDDDDGVDYDAFQEKSSVYKRLKEWLKKRRPFQKDIDRVQARFGKAVTSYFIFYRFVFLQAALFGLAAVVFGTIHISFQVALYNADFVTLMTGQGFLPGFMLHSSYNQGEAFDYSLFLILGAMVLLVSIIEHLITEDKHMKRVDASLKGNEAPYAKDLFCAWDMSGCKDTNEARDQKGTISQSFNSKLEESRIAEERKSRSRFDVFVLYLRRFIGLILYLAVQGASFIAIALVTIYTENITNAVADQGFSSFSSIIAPLALNIINGAAPTLLKAITLLEKWDSGDFKVNILLARMFLSNIMNTLILAVSYLLLADPFLLANYPSFRALLELKESGAFTCRIDQCADAMFSLLITNFFIQNAFRFLVPYGKILMQRVQNKTTIKNDPFEIEPAMINLFSYMSLVMITFPFAPLAMVFLPVAFWVKIKWEVWVMVNYQARPKKTWQAQKSGWIFTSFYLATLTIIGLPAMIFFLSTNTFPKNCDIQDSYVRLCADSVSDDNTCTTDSSNQYYSAYGAADYPSTICSGACGPFVSYESSLTPVKSVIYSLTALKYVYIVLFETSYFTWVVVLVLFITRGFKNNTIKVDKEEEATTERVISTKMAELEASVRKANKAMERMKRESESEAAMRMLSPRPAEETK